MAKEYHITFSCGMLEEGSRSAVGQIQRLMRDGGAELISKNDDDGFMDIVFHHHSSPETVTSLCNKVLEQFKNSYVSVSTSVYEHKPSVLVDTKDVKDVDQFKKFVEELAGVQGYTSIGNDEKDPTLWKINFAKSAQRQSFQNDFTAKAGEYMTKGHSSVNIFPDWEDITFLQKNNYSDKKRTSKYGR
jgi:hypothetical protein